MDTEHGRASGSDWLLDNRQRPSGVQIYSCRKDVLCGALVGFPMNPANDPMPETWNHKSQCRFVFVRNLRPRE